MRRGSIALDHREPPNPFEIAVCSRDREWRISRHFWIKYEDGPVKRIADAGLKRSQMKLLNLIQHIRDRNEAVRIIVLKARKTGISTVIEADLFCEVLDRGIDALILAHDLETTKKIFGMTQIYYQNYDLDKPVAKRSNPRELIFLDHYGHIMVQTANNKFSGTGLTPQYVHSSETPKWETGAETAVSLLQAVSDKPGTTVIHEGSAWGYDKFFYPTWRGAYDNCKVTFDKNLKPTITVTDPKSWNYYVPLFISVFDDPACRREFASKDDSDLFAQSLTGEEERILDRHAEEGADLEYLNYRRYTLKNKCQDDVSIYHQEHCETPAQAFIMSGRPRLDRNRLLDMHMLEGRTGTLKEVKHGWEERIEFAEGEDPFLTIYKSPQRHHNYVIGVDVSEGIMPDGCKDPDRSVAIVLDIDQGCEQVATLCGTRHQPLSQENLKYPLWLLAQWYNEAFLVIEINGPGQSVADSLPNEPYNYPEYNFYHLDDWDRDAKMSRRIGWRTTSTSRTRLMDFLAEGTKDGSYILRDKRTLDECLNLIWGKGGRVEAQHGSHDDHCFGLALALEGARNCSRYKTMKEQLRRPASMMRQKTEYQDTVDPISGY